MSEKKYSGANGITYLLALLRDKFNTKVDKIDGQGLSANNLTAALKEKYDAAYTHSQSTHAPTSAERNTLVGIQTNGVDVAIDASTRKANIDLATYTTTSAMNTALSKKVNDYTIDLYNGTVGNPKGVKCVTVDYSNCTSETGVLIKIGMVSGHGNGTSYTFLQDAIIKVNQNGDVEVDNFKYYGAATSTYDDAVRQYGDIFWVVDATNKVVDFYCLMGQYSHMYQTPLKRLNQSTGGTITQYTGSCAVYASGTKVWANNSDIALMSDVDAFAEKVDAKLPLAGGTMTGNLMIENNTPHTGFTCDGTTAYLQAYNDGGGVKIGLGFGWGSSLKVDTDGNVTMAGNSRPTYNGDYLARYDDIGIEIQSYLCRLTAVNVADTNYTTLMARGTSLNSAETNPAVNGAIAWTYE